MAVSGCGGGQLANSPTPLSASELRDLSDAEKKIIATAVGVSLKDRASAQFRWTKFPIETPMDGLARYCATVNGKIFVASVTVVDGKAATAQLLAVGGTSGGYVDLECRRYYVSPFT
jgi:hypothetical protein